MQEKKNLFLLFALSGLPLLALAAKPIYNRIIFSSEHSMVSGETSMAAPLNATFDLDSVFMPTVDFLAERVNEGNLRDLMEVEYSDGTHVLLSYRPKLGELRYGYFGEDPTFVAHDVTPSDIIKAARKGRSFKFFKNYQQLRDLD